MHPPRPCEIVDGPSAAAPVRCRADLVEGGQYVHHNPTTSRDTPAVTAARRAASPRSAADANEAEDSLSAMPDRIGTAGGCPRRSACPATFRCCGQHRAVAFSWISALVGSCDPRPDCSMSDPKRWPARIRATRHTPPSLTLINFAGQCPQIRVQVSHLLRNASARVLPDRQGRSSENCVLFLCEPHAGRPQQDRHSDRLGRHSRQNPATPERRTPSQRPLLEGRHPPARRQAGRTQVDRTAEELGELHDQRVPPQRVHVVGAGNHQVLVDMRA